MSKYNSSLFNNLNGYYGPNQDFGGQYVPEMLVPVLDELEAAFNQYRNDPDFLKELEHHYKYFIGRPSPLIYAKNLSEKIGGAKIYLKNEGANHTGSHKITHCVYQALLAKRMGKTKVICETGAGQHGLACATVCAKFGLKCEVYMGQVDIERQYPNVFFMELLGAKVIPVTQGSQTLADSVDAALAAFITHPDSFYMLGSAVGPHPYPELIREAQSIVSKESKQQLNELEGKLPDVVVACIGGGSNAIGAFNEYLTDDIKLIGVEAGGKDIKTLGQHASRIASKKGKIGIMQGFKSVFLLDENGQNIPTQSVAAGLNYPGIGPIHGYLHSIGRLELTSISNQEAMDALKILAQSEGVLAAIESSHAIAEGIKQAKNLPKDKIILINASGRADNYLFNLAKAFENKEFEQFCNLFKL